MKSTIAECSVDPTLTSTKGETGTPAMEVSTLNNKSVAEVTMNGQREQKGRNDTDEESEEDFIVEKVVAKRYNHKKLRFEYLLKWQGYPNEQNTWEPLSNLYNCKYLVQSYETNPDPDCARQLDSYLNSVQKGPPKAGRLKPKSPEESVLSSSTALTSSSEVKSSDVVGSDNNKGSHDSSSEVNRLVPAPPFRVPETSTNTASLTNGIELKNKANIDGTEENGGTEANRAMEVEASSVDDTSFHNAIDYKDAEMDECTTSLMLLSEASDIVSSVAKDSEQRKNFKNSSVTRNDAVGSVVSSFLDKFDGSVRQKLFNIQEPVSSPKRNIQTVSKVNELTEKKLEKQKRMRDELLLGAQKAENEEKHEMENARPSRSSKQKAYSQLNQWVKTMYDGDQSVGEELSKSDSDFEPDEDELFNGEEKPEKKFKSFVDERKGSYVSYGTLKSKSLQSSLQQHTSSIPKRQNIDPVEMTNVRSGIYKMENKVNRAEFTSLNKADDDLLPCIYTGNLNEKAKVIVLCNPQNVSEAREMAKSSSSAEEFILPSILSANMLHNVGKQSKPPVLIRDQKTFSRYAPPKKSGIIKKSIMEKFPHLLTSTAQYSKKDTTNITDVGKNESALKKIFGSNASVRSRHQNDNSLSKPTPGGTFGASKDEVTIESDELSSYKNVPLLDSSYIEPYMAYTPLPDDFPKVINDEPLSPVLTISLDPATGNRLSKADGERTPEPTPPPSPPEENAVSSLPMPVVQNDQAMSVESHGNEVTMIVQSSHQDGGNIGGVDDEFIKIENESMQQILRKDVAMLSQNEGINLDGTRGEFSLATAAVDLENSQAVSTENLLTITGEDGHVYQLAGGKIETDTIMVADDEDIQCVYTMADGFRIMRRVGEDGSPIFSMDDEYSNIVAYLATNQLNILPDGSQIYIKLDETGELIQIEPPPGADELKPVINADDEAGAEMGHSGDLILPDGMNLMGHENMQNAVSILDAVNVTDEVDMSTMISIADTANMPADAMIVSDAVAASMPADAIIIPNVVASIADAATISGSKDIKREDEDAAASDFGANLNLNNTDEIKWVLSSS